MKILFLDQSSKLGGAELCLADIVYPHRDTSLVAVFNDGPFPDYLRQRGIPVQTLIQNTLQVQKNSGLLTGIRSLNQLLPLILKVAQLSRAYNLIYTNTQKALVVGAIASALSGRPFIYHLHDIVSPDHFSATNRRLIVTLANRARLVIANSHASKQAFIDAGGSAERVHVVYNGFQIEKYAVGDDTRATLRQSLQLTDTNFVVGHFSRLSPWKGQHVLIEALTHTPDHVIALLIGDALFGEEDYVQQLHQQIDRLSLQHRVKFLGFRSDIPQLMAACDLIAHTSTAPEPFGRVIVEGVLCRRPVVAANAGGATELIDHGQTGWLTPSGNAQNLAEIITSCCQNPHEVSQVIHQGNLNAQERFNLDHTNHQIHQLLEQAIAHL